MSVTFSLCIRTGHTDIDGLAQELSQILGIALTPRVEVPMEEKFYEYSDTTTMEWVRLWHNYLEDSVGIPFESYEFVLIVWALYKNNMDYKESSRQFGERLFEVLRQLQTYDLLLVRDAREILMKYECSSPSEELP